ncbi:MAG TPA: 3-oxoacyl-[acyl-carrier-protein] synthase III C-terminal domain-containing protein [Candidatus Binataceae bacterium]|nr:3-oxoacyl-[acyl-carrier-protein] synthase III C-terminal domain-containing protein [Candidatus Binataceae bacterium]
MKIVSVGSKFPAHRYSQKEVTDALCAYWGEALGSRSALLERFHSRTRVEWRHLAFPFERYYEFKTWGETNRAWFEVAEELGAGAIGAALARAGLSPRNVDALYVVSTTGIASPSLDARLINRMGFRPELKRTPIFGLGCVAGTAGLSRAADYVKGYPDEVAILLSVELCSLTIRRDDLSPANLIATGIFGDGAAAAIVAGSARSANGPEIISHRSVFYRDTEEIMGWDISENGFEIVLSQKLPALIREHLAGDVDSFLGANGLGRRDIGSWVIHPGGPKVLQAVEVALGLHERELRLSWESLARVGNLSSASVLCVLEDTMTQHRPRAGTMGLIAAMGPGFCSELMLVRW